jgi:hypothetical protein
MISLRIHANVMVCKEKTEKERINKNKWYSLDIARGICTP